MERLTMTSDKGGVAFTFGLDLICEKSEMLKILKLAERLKYYEDLEEQGLLLKLPCKVGDTVYAIEADEEKFEHFHCGFKISKLEFDFWMMPIFGKCIFLTQAEAEEALNRLERDGG